MRCKKRPRATGARLHCGKMQIKIGENQRFQFKFKWIKLLPLLSLCKRQLGNLSHLAVAPSIPAAFAKVLVMLMILLAGSAPAADIAQTIERLSRRWSASALSSRRAAPCSLRRHRLCRRRRPACDYQRARRRQAAGQRKTEIQWSGLERRQRPAA